MLGKIISYGRTREAAIARMQNALQEMVLEGIKNNKTLQQMILEDKGFQAGGTNIHYLENLLKQQK